MSIILKILIGLVLLFALVTVGIVATVFVAVVSHERRWRKSLSDDYKMYNDAIDKSEHSNFKGFGSTGD